MFICTPQRLLLLHYRANVHVHVRMQHSDMHHQRWSLSPLSLCLAQILSGNNGALRRNVLAYKLRAANSAVLDLYPQLQTLADSFGAPPLDTLYAFCNCCIDSYHPACHAYVPCKTLGTHILSDCSSNACLSFSAVALCFDAAQQTCIASPLAGLPESAGTQHFRLVTIFCCCFCCCLRL